MNLWLLLAFYTALKIPYSSLIIYDGTGLSGSYVYFVHGYHGHDSQFQDMIDYLNKTCFFSRTPSRVTPRYFDYCEKYLNLGMSKEEIHNIEGGISTYATDFFEMICDSHSSPTQVDIVAHSLGGLIIREMLRKHHADLEILGITIGRVITVGTPHFGSELFNHPFAEYLREFIGCDATLIDLSFAPESEFLSQLNENPSSYMKNIEWYFVAGVSLEPTTLFLQETVFSGVPCDGLVDLESALAIGLDFEPINRIILPKNHHNLIFDPQDQDSYTFIAQWLGHNN